MRFPVAAKTFRAPFSTAAAPPMAFASGLGLPPIGFVTLPNSAVHEYSPLRLAADVLLVVASQNKITHSAAIIAQRHMLAICDGAFVSHQSHAITPTESKFSSCSLSHSDYRLSLRRGGRSRLTSRLLADFSASYLLCL
jgi:hypothetical protein